MAATTTQSITLLIDKLIAAYPAFHFKRGADFRWDPTQKTIFYNEASSDTASLLHELAHAILGHESFNKDIELIEIERDAWTHATKQLSPIYDIAIPNEIVEEALDTYRDWLHARSTCPNCSATGVQTKKGTYSCIVCSTHWRVNDARVCALRRYTLTK